MPRPSFRQNDLQKALRAARAAGFDAEEVRITEGGEIRLLAKREKPSHRDVLDEIEGWARDQR